LSIILSSPDKFEGLGGLHVVEQPAISGTKKAVADSFPHDVRVARAAADLVERAAAAVCLCEEGAAAHSADELGQRVDAAGAHVTPSALWRRRA
jgi:hypothetical protein